LSIRKGKCPVKNENSFEGGYMKGIFMGKENLKSDYNFVLYPLLKNITKIDQKEVGRWKI
jgi:hypothetical protein